MRVRHKPTEEDHPMKTLLTLAAACLLAMPAVAHEVAKGPNGGRIADAGAHHVELVTKEKTVEVHLTDAGDKPVGAAGSKGLALLIVDGKSQRIALSPAGEYHFAGTATVVLPKLPKGAVQLTTPDRKTAIARFN